MRLRALVNGSVIDVPDEEGHALLKTGVFEEVIDEPKAKKGTYKRRDLTAEGRNMTPEER